MTCADVTELLDAFVDAELPPPMLLAVARHAAACPSCDTEVRQLSALHEAIDRTGRAAAETLDLSRVWPAVEARIDRVEARRGFAQRLRSAPVWGAALAMAAGALFWMRGTEPDSGHVVARAAAARPNHAVIERIDSNGPFELRRDRKSGTTLIMVSAADTTGGVP